MTLEVPPQYQKNRGGRPPGPRPIADRVVRLQMAAAAARLYPKVLAFWEEVLEGTATYQQDGKKFLKYTTEDRFEATRMIMAYGFGKPVQPLAGRSRSGPIERSKSDGCRRGLTIIPSASISRRVSDHGRHCVHDCAAAVMLGRWLWRR